MSGGLAIEGRDAQAQAALGQLQEALSQLKWATEDIAIHSQRGHPAYWACYDHETLVRHASFIREAEVTGMPIALAKEVNMQRERNGNHDLRWGSSWAI